MAGDRRVMDGGRVMTYKDYLTAADGGLPDIFYDQGADL